MVVFDREAGGFSGVGVQLGSNLDWFSWGWGHQKNQPQPQPSFSPYFNQGAQNNKEAITFFTVTFKETSML